MLLLHVPIISKWSMAIWGRKNGRKNDSESMVMIISPLNKLLRN